MCVNFLGFCKDSFHVDLTFGDPPRLGPPMNSKENASPPFNGLYFIENCLAPYK